MRMKQRIFIYNTLSIVAALVTMLVVNSISMYVTSRYYREHSQQALTLQAIQVQSAMESWDFSTGDWAALDQDLETFGFDLRVSQQSQEIYSSLDHKQEEIYPQVAPKVWPLEHIVTIQNDGIILVGKQMESLTAVAMARPAMDGHRPQSEAVLVSLLISGLASIVVMIGLNLVFTHFQIRQLLKPVNALALAAKRVEQGDLSQPLQYHQKDELASVYAAFDHMQSHLFQEREKNAAYEQARTDLVAGISHDLRTPLTSVKGYIKGLQDGVAKTPEKQTQYLDIAYRKACDMDVLLQRLFYFSKLETGNLPLFRERMDLGQFVSKYVQDAQGELEGKGGRMVLTGEQGPCPVSIDAEQMYRVLTNLTENAIHYAQVPQLTLTLTLERRGDWVCLGFGDNGQGVLQEQLPHLFEQFWRGDQARGSRGGDGSGLGLYIVKYIMEAHGGGITAQNRDGLYFELLFPTQEVQA